MSSPFDQSRYQVRLEWGDDGLARLAASDVVVVVDVLRFSSIVTTRVAAGGAVPLDAAAHAVSLNGAATSRAAAALDPAPIVLLGCLRNASAVAEAIADEQRRRGARTSIALIAGDELVPADAGAAARTARRFAVEDLLGAGAIVDALGVRGIDHTSPEAAAAGEAFRGLRAARRHLLAASGSGQELAERGAHDEVRAAAELDASTAVPVLREGVFVAL
ncbi:2-phosphosulfolactate phosphatase [Microbacterium lacticum]|uniref:Probable 2-phosphosulfolactate phosphatase n=1 Tax=Microbacterium lacticum TaxID=33885 RepID=A0A543K6C1_9MICO|nr:2-phosphosulfolactate phosphatase [Microbacterium lacticum]TQM90594.1 2-phosphosulfolactate phosphatase [Microbacterium lacticum]